MVFVSNNIMHKEDSGYINSILASKSKLQPKCVISITAVVSSPAGSPSC